MKPTVLLGEAYGSNEARLGTGFVGASGIELLRMLSEAAIITLTSEDHAFIQKFWQTSQPAHIDMIWRMHPELHRTNVFNLHPPGNRIESFCGPRADGIPGYPALVKPAKYARAEFQPELDRLADELLALDPNLVIALGNTPLWALCGTTGISKLRGTTRLSTHTVTGFKVLPTYHPAAVLRQWELRPTTVADLIKAGRERGFAEVRRPECEIWIEPTLEDINDFFAKYTKPGSNVSVDIETSGDQITCIGFSSAGKSCALVVPFFDSRRKDRSYWGTAKDERQAWERIAAFLGSSDIPKVFQNGLYDIAFLWRSVGIKVRGAEHDTMLLHHALQPEALKGLQFLGSIYTNHHAWKSERRGTTTIKRDE